MADFFGDFNNNPYGDTSHDRDGWSQSGQGVPPFILGEEPRREEFFRRYQSIFEGPEPPRNTPPSPPPRPKREKQGRGKSMALLVALCMVLSGLTGFAGGYGASVLLDKGGASNAVTAAPAPQSPAAPLSAVSPSGVNIAQVAAMAAPSVVEVTTESVTRDSFLGNRVIGGAGSGVIVSQDGYIATNYHVIDGANTIKVRLSDGATHTARLVGGDEAADIAVIKIQAEGLPAAVMGDSDSLVVGDFALAIGNPLGELGGTVTNGIISALSRQVTIDGNTMTLLQTNAAINSGNSGGGLFNANGQLIGIVNAKSMGSGIEGLGFAIPINAAKPLIQDLMTVGYVTGRPYLGVNLINIGDAYTAMRYKVQYLGVYVDSVDEGSADQQAGLRAGDCILSADGQQISSGDQLAAIIAQKSVGDTLALQIMRDGLTQDLTATLAEYIPVQ